MGDENALTNSAYIILNICTLNSMNSATTFSLLTFNITTLSIIDLIAILSTNDTQHKNKISVC